MVGLVAQVEAKLVELDMLDPDAAVGEQGDDAGELLLVDQGVAKPERFLLAREAGLAGGGQPTIRPAKGVHVTVPGKYDNQYLGLYSLVENVDDNFADERFGTPTVRGTFRFYRNQPGTNAKGMVHSSYFIRGYAIHGYASVPPYNASHGCLRVPIPDAWSIYQWIGMGDVVRVYP